MKKLLALSLALIMVFALAACDFGSGNTQSAGGTSDPGTSHQTPSGGKVFDMTDDQIRAYDKNLTELQGDARAEMITKIPADIKKAVGTVGAGLCTIRPSRSGEGYSFGMTLYVSDKDVYKTLTDYYKSLGGTITVESEPTDTTCQLNIDYSWGQLTNCLYRNNESGDDTVQIAFTIN